MFELSDEIMEEFRGIRLSMYSYIPDDDNVEKMAKGTKKYIIKSKLNFNDYKSSITMFDGI